MGLKHAEGFARPLPTVLTAAIVASQGLLGRASQWPLGAAHAAWAGLGTALLGIWLFREPAVPLRLLCIGLIVAGTVGPMLASPS